MKRLLVSMLIAAAALSADGGPVTIEPSDDYSKTFNIRLNGPFVRNEAVLQQLSDKITGPAQTCYCVDARTGDVQWLG